MSKPTPKDLFIEQFQAIQKIAKDLQTGDTDALLNHAIEFIFALFKTHPYLDEKTIAEIDKIKSLASMEKPPKMELPSLIEMEE